MRKRNGCPPEEVLHAFAEGLLTDDERSAVERHVGSCERCRGAVSELREVRRALRGAAARRGPGPAPRRGCPGDELLAAYADDSLDGRRAGRVEAHLAACPSCAAVVADLIAMSAAREREAPRGAIEAALARLDRERRTAVVRLAERSIVLVRDFIGGGASGSPGALEPAFATARSAGAPVRLRWSQDGGIEVECEVRRAPAGATLTGRVTSGGAPARATSVSLFSREGARGPESLDPRGRFGPWPLPEGESRLVLTGGADDAGTTELSIEVERKEAGDR